MLKNSFKKNSIVNKYQKLITQINELEDELKFLSDHDLRLKSFNLKKLCKTNTDLIKALPESFALTREASWRKIGLKHFDVQLLGGLILNNGKIAEMKTGEGKTLVATLPASLNALTGKGVHIVTVNEYLAGRDQILMGQIYRFLGLSTGLVEQGMPSVERVKNYKADITYVTNNELVFDFLRDNMVTNLQELVLKPFNYCIIDEVDSILIDEAQTPLIIAVPIPTLNSKHIKASEISNYLKSNVHYKVDEKNKNIILTEEGNLQIEKILTIENLYDPADPWIPYIINAIKAKALYFNNINYMIQNQRIIIVDEFTGRIMPDRRWGEGLHQAIEAKEQVPIRKGTETLASITYQNFFLSYPKLSGMTGTAKTAEIEFEKIYKLSVETIPTARPNIRKDLPDLIYCDQFSKWTAIAQTCNTISIRNQPILIGTTTVEKSEMLSQLLDEYKLEYQLLNAKPENIRKESEIVAQAGKKKTITIATNMAGRGTDIILGGNLKFKIQKTLYELLTIIVNSKKDQQITTISKILNSFPGISQKFLSLLIPLITDNEFIQLSDVEILKLLRETNQISKITIKYQRFIQLLVNEFSLTSAKHQKQDNKIVKNLGGLYIIGTDRNDSKRVDNQLRGRCGRQGDPGTSRFFLSIDDTILRLFGGSNVQNYLRNQLFKNNSDLPLESQFLTKSLDNAQQTIEEKYYEQRKNLFEYDEVLNQQRKKIYNERRQILETKSIRNKILEYGEQITVEHLFQTDQNINSDLVNHTNPIILDFYLFKKNYRLTEFYSTKFDKALYQKLFYNQIWGNLYLTEMVFQSYEPFDSNQIELFESMGRRYVLLLNDTLWKEHLQKMTLLRDAVNWRSYGQKNPLYEYKAEAYSLFQNFQVILRQLVFDYVKRISVL